MTEMGAKWAFGHLPPMTAIPPKPDISIRRDHRPSLRLAIGGATGIGRPVAPGVAIRAVIDDHHVDVRVMATVARKVTPRREPPFEVERGRIAAYLTAVLAARITAQPWVKRA
jgi:hypothetical protein